MQRLCVTIALLCSLSFACDLIIASDTSSLYSQIIGEKIFLGHHINNIMMNIEYGIIPADEKTELFSELSLIRDKSNNLHLAEFNHHKIFTFLLNELSKLDEFDFDACVNPCNIYDCAIFDNFTQSKAYLVNASCDFLRELLDDSRDQIVGLFLKSYSISLPQSVAEFKDPFLLSMLQLLANQTLTNPSYYVSHGVDHSVRVMEWNYKLRQVVSPAMSNLYGCTLSDANDMDGTNSTCTFILMLDGILHDTGYIDISGTHGVKKFVHAVSGSVLDQILFEANSEIGMTIVNSAGNFSGNSTQLVTDAFLRSIKTHNNDDQSCLWITGPNYNSSCTSITTPLLNSWGYPTPVVRNYTQPEALLDPLSFIIRVSDNLDSMNSRLTKEQTDQNFMTYLCYLYTDNELRISGNSPDAQPAARQRAINAVQKLNSSNPWNTTDIMGMLNSTDLQSFLFFYSVWMVDDITVTWAPDFSSFQLYVQIHEPAGNECNHCYLGFKSHPGPTLYQINRLAISMHSLFINNTSFLNKITVKLSQEVPGINGTTFLLKDFTQKEVFNSSGPTGQYICEDCQFYLPLTNSPENCLDINGKVVTCADVTQLGSPFADLSFETTLAPDYPQCTPKHKEHKPWWFWLVTVAVPIVVVLALVATIAIVMKARHKKGYTRIQ